MRHLNVSIYSHLMALLFYVSGYALYSHISHSLPSLCLSSLPLGDMGWTRRVIVALSGRFI